MLGSRPVGAAAAAFGMGVNTQGQYVVSYRTHSMSEGGRELQHGATKICISYDRQGSVCLCVH